MTETEGGDSMDANRTCIWKGARGRTYTFRVYTLPQSFAPGQNGNYIFTKLDNGVCPALYIGQGDFGDRVGEGHHKWRCILSKGATQVHVHLNEDEAARLEEEADLLAGNPEAYAPFGCNEKPGG